MVLGIDVVKVERIMLKEKEMRNAFLVSDLALIITFVGCMIDASNPWYIIIQCMHDGVW